jgi:hypothetical protein
MLYFQAGYDRVHASFHFRLMDEPEERGITVSFVHCGSYRVSCPDPILPVELNDTPLVRRREATAKPRFVMQGSGVTAARQPAVPNSVLDRGSAMRKSCSLDALWKVVRQHARCKAALPASAGEVGREPARRPPRRRPSRPPLTLRPVKRGRPRVSQHERSCASCPRAVRSLNRQLLPPLSAPRSPNVR